MMALRRWVTLVFLFAVIIVGVIWLRYEKAFTTAPKSPRSVTVSVLNTAIGAVNSTDTSFDKQKMSFSATIWNNTSHTVFVTTVKVNLPSSLQSHVLTGITLIAVNKILAPNGTYQITGAFILDTKGMTKQEIVKLGSIEGLTVNTKSP